MEGNRHYIRLNNDGCVVMAFSDAFQQPEKGDILIAENADRHFNMDLFNHDGTYRYKYEKKSIVERTQSDIEDGEDYDKIISEQAKQKLIEIDLASIRSIREYIASKADCPATLKEHEADAIKEREKVK